ncbi:MAG: hypothetical protein PHU66_06460 [Bacteroidaceae bacterium]|nr:hypothetical protein [Bacteroidaceae bacterium]
MKKENIIEKGVVAIKGITAMIPVLGGTLTSVWSDIEAIQAKRKHERLEEFYLALETEVQKIKEQINESYVNQPDFLDVFEQTAKHIVNERREEKRVLFRNILLNSIIAKGCSYDKTEKYLRILEQMNGLELLILRVLQNPSKFNRQNGEKIKDPNAPTPGYRNMITHTRTYFFIDMLGELLNASKEDIAESIYYLESNRLIADNASLSKLQTNGHPIHALEDKLTPKGKDFISFILCC